MKLRNLVLALFLCISLGLLPQGVVASDSVPFSLDAPTNLTVEIKYDQNNWPYFAITLDVPERVQTINDSLSADYQHYPGANCMPVVIRFEAKYGDYDWNQAPSMYTLTEMAVSDLLGEMNMAIIPMKSQMQRGASMWMPKSTPSGPTSIPLGDILIVSSIRRFNRTIRTLW